MFLTIMEIVPLLGSWEEFACLSFLISLSLSQWTKQSLSLGCLEIPCLCWNLLHFCTLAHLNPVLLPDSDSPTLVVAGALCAVTQSSGLQISVTVTSLRNTLFTSGPGKHTHTAYIKLKQKSHKILIFPKHPAFYTLLVSILFSPKMCFPMLSCSIRCNEI